VILIMLMLLQMVPSIQCDVSLCDTCNDVAAAVGSQYPVWCIIMWYNVSLCDTCNAAAAADGSQYHYVILIMMLLQMVPSIQCDGSEHMSRVSSGVDGYYPIVKKSPLTASRKIYEFYTAPITKFWMHTVHSHICHLLAIFHVIKSFVICLLIQGSPPPLIPLSAISRQFLSHSLPVLPT